MRLTIRTLLAYLDDVLSPEDRDALTVKLQESEFARQLADGLRASVRQTHLGSPPVETDQAVEDANTVAEYLDNMLDADAVADIERRLLESGAHLSEVASCHHILTIALTKAADVPPELRERMYRLRDATIAGSAASVPSTSSPSVLDGQHAADHTALASAADGQRVAGNKPAADPTSTNADVQEPSAATFVANKLEAGDGSLDAHHAESHAQFPVGTATGGKSKPEIPEYLRPSWQQRLLPWAMTIGVAGLLVVIVYKIFINPVSRLAGDIPVVTSEEETRDGSSSTSASEDLDVADDADQRGALGTNESASDGPGAKVGERDASPTDDGDSSVRPAATAETQPASATAKPEPVEPGDKADAATERPENPDPIAVADPSSVTDPVAVPKPSPPGDPVNPNPKPLPREQVGTMKSTDGLLLMKTEEGWKRVKSEGRVDSDRTLVNLPTFRSTLNLEGGAELTAVGASDFSFLATQESAPWMSITRGKFVLSASTPGSLVAMTIGNLSGSLNLVDAESVASLQVAWFRPPGRSPEAEDAHVLLIDVRAVIGQVNWAIDGAEPVILDPLQRWVLVDGQDPIVQDGEIPAWIVPEPENLASIESTARNGLLSLIEEGKQIQMILQESIGFRRSEVAALGARSLLLLGISDVYFGVDGILNNEEQKLHWEEHFTALQNELNFGGQRARVLRETTERMSAADADDLYRLLWGYSQEQLIAGADFELVEGLSSPVMAIRVLAIENLRLITGDKMYYRPQDNAIRRDNAIKKWETKVKTGSIRWEKIPAPLDAVSR